MAWTIVLLGCVWPNLVHAHTTQCHSNADDWIFIWEGNLQEHTVRITMGLLRRQREMEREETLDFREVEVRKKELRRSGSREGC